MSALSSHLSLKDGKKTSRSRVVRDKLDYPVIDTDLHTIEFAPILEDYIAKYGGPRSGRRVPRRDQPGLRLPEATEWYELTPEQRAAQRSVRPPWWALPTKNTYDLATVSPPGLLHERLGESGTDYAVLFPNVSTFATHVGKADLRRALIRAVNAYHADVYRAVRRPPHACRGHPAAHAGGGRRRARVRRAASLGLKVALIPGNLRRPIRSVAEKYPSRHHPDVARHANWLDTFGVDSEHNYDPFWAKAVELRTVPTTPLRRDGVDQPPARSSSYMYNHIGHFASASRGASRSRCSSAA